MDGAPPIPPAAAGGIGARAAPDTIRRETSAFHLLVENTIDYAIFMLDPSGVVASWNAGAQRIKGYATDEIVGKHFSIFYTEDAKARRWPEYELKEAARLGRFEDEGWRVRKDGSRFWANVVITALRGPDGELRGFGKVTRDITERKTQQERIENLTRELQNRVAELATSNRELMQKTSENETFVYSVSHDLRAPLVNLQGFSHELTLTQEELQGLLSDSRIPAELRARAHDLLSREMTESIDFIRNAVQHLGNIVDGLLRLSRVGRVEYRMEPVNVQAVLAEILASLHTTVSATGATIRVGALPTVKGDRNAIGQVFANIIGNALKSLDGERPGLIEISASAGDPPVFAIKDNGVGIPDEYRRKIFQVFQHVHPTHAKGEGMGLAIVQRIVERHGGRIWFESARGVGSTFLFTFSPSGGPPPAETAGG